MHVPSIQPWHDARLESERAWIELTVHGTGYLPVCTIYPLTPPN